VRQYLLLFLALCIILPRGAFSLEKMLDPEIGEVGLNLIELKLAAEGEKPSAVAHNNLGIAYAAAGKPYEAIAEFEKAHRITPGDAAVAFNLGVAHAGLKNYKAALSCLEEAVSLCPDNAAAIFNIGVIHLDMGLTGDAIGDLERALLLSPAHPLIHYNLAVAYENDKDGLRYGPGFPADKALEHYRMAIDGGLDNVAIRYNIGIIHSKRGDYGMAVAEFSKACEFDPDFLLARRGLALALIHQGKYHRAIRELERSAAASGDTAASPALALAYRKLGSFYLENGDYWRALAQFEKALQHDRDDAVSHLNTGRIHTVLGNYAEALREIKIAGELDPGLGAAQYLARVYFLKGVDFENDGDYRLALAEYKKAVDARQDFALANLVMGELCADKLGKKEEAVKYFRRCLELEPEGSYSRQAAEKISALTGSPGAGK